MSKERSEDTEEAASSSGMKALGETVKRVMGDFMATISPKPTKLARYSDGGKDDSFQPIEEFYREMQTSSLEMSLSSHSFRCVIPPDKLRLDERHTPLDVEAFLSRVETYSLLLWPSKPEQLNAFQCARYGWRIAGMNTLVCVSCHRVEVIPREPPSCVSLKDWSSKIEARIKKAGHMSGCIWTKSPSPENIIQLPSGCDMQLYLIQAAQSFKHMKTLPFLSNNHRKILAAVDLQGLKLKTYMKLEQDIEGATTEMIERMAMYLIMNGWTIDPVFEDVLKCHRCLREVPLWLSDTTPAQVVVNEIMSPDTSPRSQAMSNIKELDPVCNHCVWCPWRIELQTVSTENVDEYIVQEEDFNLYSNAGVTADIRKMPTIKDYMKLACKIDSDFKSEQLLHGDILEMSDNETAIKTLLNVKELLSSVTGRKDSSNKTVEVGKYQAPCNVVKLPEGLLNSIMLVKSDTDNIRQLDENDDRNDDFCSQDEMP